mmetsp:Transcript_5320/g.13910  ORF Transcript_5320/g.13910 Transcript_5320/m.13910 type:complete len:416 (-) Transcript_5320:848-2095(-)
MHATKTNNFLLLNLGHCRVHISNLGKCFVNSSGNCIAVMGLLACPSKLIRGLQLSHRTRAPLLDSHVHSSFHLCHGLGRKGARVKVLVYLPPAHLLVPLCLHRLDDALVALRSCLGVNADNPGEESFPNLQPGHELGVSAEKDVCPSAGHVGGYGYGSPAAALSDNLGLPLHVLGLGVQQLVGDLFLVQLLCKGLALLDRGRANQDGATPLVHPPNLNHDSIPFAPLGPEHDVCMVRAIGRPVRGNHSHGEAVDVFELRCFCGGRSGHPRHLLVGPEEVLVRDGRERDCFILDLDAFLRLDGLVQPLAPPPPRHGPPRELVDDHNLAPLDDVVDVPLLQLLGLDGVRHEGYPLLLGVVEVRHLEHGLDRLVALLGKQDSLPLLLHGVVGVLHEGRGDLACAVVLGRGLLGLPGDD